MNLEELRQFKPQILEIAAQYGVNDIQVFGSVARGDADENSDVDLFLDGFKGSLLRFASMKTQLEDLIGNAVDLRERQHIRHPLIWQSISQDLKPL
jgi:predicted nucleotidyltransferase